jgi:four helix bundle protein
MSDGTKSSKDKEIYTRIDKFVLSVLSIVKILPRDIVNTVVLKQLIRSSTSIGANVREGQTAQTRKEFSHCFSISKREANETRYWLWILLNQNSSYKTKIEILIKECDELIAIISSIILSTNRKKD